MFKLNCINFLILKRQCRLDYWRLVARTEVKQKVFNIFTVTSFFIYRKKITVNPVQTLNDHGISSQELNTHTDLVLDESVEVFWKPFSMLQRNKIRKQSSFGEYNILHSELMIIISPFFLSIVTYFSENSFTWSFNYHYNYYWTWA